MSKLDKCSFKNWIIAYTRIVWLSHQLRKWPGVYRLVDVNVLTVCLLFRVRMVFKATKARLHENCGVSTRRKRVAVGVFLVFNNRIMIQAVSSGKRHIKQVLPNLSACQSLEAFIFILFHTRQFVVVIIIIIIITVSLPSITLYSSSSTCKSSSHHRLLSHPTDSFHALCG